MRPFDPRCIDTDEDKCGGPSFQDEENIEQSFHDLESDDPLALLQSQDSSSLASLAPASKLEKSSNDFTGVMIDSFLVSFFASMIALIIVVLIYRWRRQRAAASSASQTGLAKSG